MNYMTVRPRKRRSHQLLFPSIGNILNDVMQSPMETTKINKENGSRYTVPPVNVKELGDRFVINMVAPGMTKDQIKIDVENDTLTISKVAKEEGKVSFVIREFNYDTFKRSFFIPESVDQEMIEASMQQGVLVINLIKKEEKKDKGPQKITIS